jgi:hypothetical protein
MMHTIRLFNHTGFSFFVILNIRLLHRLPPTQPQSHLILSKILALSFQMLSFEDYKPNTCIS